MNRHRLLPLLSLWVTLGFLAAGSGCGARRETGGTAPNAGARVETASPSNSDVANDTENPVLVTFDGGELRLDEFESFLDAKTEFTARGQKIDPRVQCRADSSNLDRRLEEAALGKIAAHLFRDRHLDPHGLFEIDLNNKTYRAAWTFFMLTRMYPDKIEPAYLEFEKKMRDYYDTHREESIKAPGKVSFRMIFLNGLDADDAARGEKRALAERLLDELKANPDRFLELARQHSDAEPDVREQVFGPYDPSKINKALAQAIEPLKPGGISAVVENPKGFYLLRLESRGEPEYKTFEEQWRYLFAKVGGFSTYNIVTEYRKDLLGDAKEPVFYLDALSTETSKGDAVIARFGHSTLTNREMSHLLFILADMAIHDPGELDAILTPIIDKKALFEAAKQRGHFDSPRYQKYIEAYRRTEYLARLMEQPGHDDLKKLFPNWDWEAPFDETLKKEMRVTIIRRPDL